MSLRKPSNSHPRRVLMTAGTAGGVWTFAMELCEGLALRGAEILLATLGDPPSAAQIREAERIPTVRLLASKFKLEWMEDPWSDIEASGRWLLNLERKFAPDVVHLNSYGHAHLPWRSRTVLSVHSCVASWWKAVKSEPLPPSWTRYANLVQQALKSADRIVAPSRAMLQGLQENYGSLNSARTQVIPNGRLASCFSRQQKEPFVLASGRLWDAAKGIGTLAEIAEDLSWPVYLAGDCADAEKERWSRAGSRILGRLSREDLAGYYARAAIYALPARYEPFGLSVLEAALSGCALVLGDIPSLREVWGGYAVFVPPGNPEALSHTVRHLIDSPAERELFAARAYQRAREFDPDRMAGQYLMAYALAQKERSACIA